MQDAFANTWTERVDKNLREALTRNAVKVHDSNRDRSMENV